MRLQNVSFLFYLRVAMPLPPAKRVQLRLLWIINLGCLVKRQSFRNFVIYYTLRLRNE